MMQDAPGRGNSTPVPTAVSTPGTCPSTVASMAQPYPLLYAVGDSISIGWLPHLAHCIGKASERLPSARYTVAHAPGWGTSEMLRDRMAHWLQGHHPAVIAFNSGLHDIGRARAEWQQAVAPDRYERNVGALIGIFRTAAPSARLLWLTTTPIIRARMDATEGYRDYKREEADVDVYNAIANAVVARSGIDVLDLHGVVTSGGTERLLGPDGVHFTEDGSRLLGNLIGRRVIGEELRPAESEIR